MLQSWHAALLSPTDTMDQVEDSPDLFGKLMCHFQSISECPGYMIHFIRRLRAGNGKQNVSVSFLKHCWSFPLTHLHIWRMRTFSFPSWARFIFSMLSIGLRVGAELFQKLVYVCSTGCQCFSDLRLNEQATGVRLIDSQSPGSFNSQNTGQWKPATRTHSTPAYTKPLDAFSSERCELSGLKETFLCFLMCISSSGFISFSVNLSFFISYCVWYLSGARFNTFRSSIKVWKDKIHTSASWRLLDWQILIRWQRLYKSKAVCLFCIF